jgi:hypothetical protein
MEDHLVLSEDGDCIRQMPQNYLVAQRVHKNDFQKNGVWVSEPDLACNKALAVRVYLALFEFEVKYGSGEAILKAVESN